MASNDALLHRIGASAKGATKSLRVRRISQALFVTGAAVILEEVRQTDREENGRRRVDVPLLLLSPTVS